MAKSLLTIQREARESLDRQHKKISEHKRQIIEGLPHLYGRKWYAWAKAFFKSRNKMNLLVAANQISKSSTQIRKCIDWMTDDKKHIELWPNKIPDQKLQFWYMYPTLEIATDEFNNKWEPEFMPRGEYKTKGQYAWKVDRDSKQNVKSIEFEKGIIYFKAYSQNVHNLQTATVHAIFTDEEMPEDMYPELNARLLATNGYFHMVFTATLNQHTWYRAMEGSGDIELFPNAHKQQVSMYDCLAYDDGTPTPWTKERIEEVIASCSSPAEVQRRVYGRFITEIGRKFSAFSPDRHYVKPFSLITGYHFYAAVDVGSGGQDNHPAAIAFLAVANDYRRGYIFRGWRGDGVVTTAGDILEKFQEMRQSIKFTMQLYDWQAKDFGTIAARAGESFLKAEKGQALGEDILNTLFKNDMLFLFDIPELQPLGTELVSLLRTTAKQKAKDDFADAMRYACTKVPWDFTAIKGLDSDADTKEVEPRPLTQAEYLALEIEERRGTVVKKIKDNWDEFEDDFAYWNEQYGS